MISIVILTYNRSKILSEQLKLLMKLNHKHLEIIIVDNCSEDDTSDIIHNLYPYVKYIKTNKNIGVSARNMGIKAASGDIIITLDDDIMGITDKDIIIIKTLFDNNVNLGAINFKIIDPDIGRICNWVHHCKEEEYHDKEFQTYEITEGAVAFRKNIFDLVGYYPEEYFISHEGPDIALRIYDQGYKIIYTPNVTVKHYYAKGGRESWRNYYYDTRNQIFLAVKYFPFLYGTIYLIRGLSSMFIYSVRDGYVKYWIKGIYDGVIGIWYYISKRKILSLETINIIKEIDSKRPSFYYMIKKRVFKREIKL